MSATAKLQREAPGGNRTSPVEGVAFLLGATLVGVGLRIARSREMIGFELPGLLRWVGAYVETYREVVVGGAVVLVGSFVAAWGIRRVLPDPLADRPLPMPGRMSTGLSAWALVGALLCHGLVSWRALRGETAPLGTGSLANTLDVVLLLLSLLLIGLAIHRADADTPACDLGFGRIDVAVAAALAAVVVSINLVELTHWRFASIGDEGAFFEMAAHLASGAAWSPFDLTGVYETHPVLDSAYQSWFLRLFGADIVGWRLGEIFGLTASSLLLYVMVRLLLGRLPAVVAALALGCNHHLMAFARIAYNNLHCIFYSILALLLLTLAWRTGRALFVFLTGCALGLGLYSFAVGLLTGPLVAVLLAIRFVRRPKGREIAAAALLIAGIVLVVTPALLTTSPGNLADLAAHHSRRELAATDPGLVARISLVQSFLVFSVNPQWYKHYVGGPLLDGVTCVFFWIGLALGVGRLPMSATTGIGVVWFSLGLVAIAFTSYAPAPFFTRLLFLTPACAFLAAVGVYGLQAALRGLGARRRLCVLLVLALAAAIPALNLRQLLVASPRVLPVSGHALTLKTLQAHPGRPIVEVGRERDQNRFKIVNRYPSLRSYYRFTTLEELEPVPAASERRRGPIYVVHDESLIAAVRRALPPGYVVETDAGPLGSPRIWRFAARE